MLSKFYKIKLREQLIIRYFISILISIGNPPTYWLQLKFPPEEVPDTRQFNASLWRFSSLSKTVSINCECVIDICTKRFDGQ